MRDQLKKVPRHEMALFAATPVMMVAIWLSIIGPYLISLNTNFIIMLALSLSSLMVFCFFLPIYLWWWYFIKKHSLKRLRELDR